MKKLILIAGAILMATSSYAGNCDYSWQQDRSGNSCGERSKYNDYGAQRTQDPYDHTGRNPSSWENIQRRNGY